MANEHVRNLRDAKKEVTQALPAANANNNSPSIDLEQTIGGQIEAIAFEIEVPALPALTDAATVTITIQDSADNSSFAAIPALATLVRTGAGGAGAAATKRRFRLPPDARRYIRFNAAVANGGGDNTAVKPILRALF